MIRRKVFSSYSEEDLINAIEERAFCEGYLAAQKEFAEEEEEARERKRKIGAGIGAGIAGIGGVGAGAGVGVRKTRDDIRGNRKNYDKLIDKMHNSAQNWKDKANSKYNTSIKELQSKRFIVDGNILGALREYDAELNKINKHHDNTLRQIDSHVEKEVKRLNEHAASMKGKIIKSGALKYGLPALAVTGIGAGMMYKNRKKDKK